MILFNAEDMFDMQQTFNSYDFNEACNKATEEQFSKATVVAPDALTFFGTSQAQERLRPRVRASSPLSNRMNNAARCSTTLCAPPEYAPRARSPIG